MRYLTGTSISQLLTYVIRNCDYWYVSGWLGSAALGSYYVAYVLPNVLRQRVSWAVSSVLFVRINQAQNRNHELQRIWRRIWGLQAGIGIPVLVGVALLADPIVRVLFGGQWQAAVQPTRVVSLIAILDLHMVVASTTLSALGLVGITVRVLLVRAGVCVLATGLALWIAPSLTAAACGILVASIVAAVLQEKQISNRLCLGISFVVDDLLRFLACTAIMCPVVVTVLFAVNSPILELLLGAAAGASSYVAFGLLLFRSTFRGLLAEIKTLAIGR
jgi:O-antigen/teichoic acid export membrane protein